MDIDSDILFVEWLLAVQFSDVVLWRRLIYKKYRHLMFHCIYLSPYHDTFGPHRPLIADEKSLAS